MDMKIAVCEDEKIVGEKLAECISGIMKSADLECSIDVFLTGEDFLSSSQYYDLLFLDCQLPDINGLTLAKRLREHNIETAIIFVTAYAEYVYESFEVRPFRYILKPIDEAKIRKALIGFLSAYEKDRFVSIPTARKNNAVKLHDIVYIESDGKYSIVRLINNSSLKSLKSISDFHAEIETDCQSFFRTHRRYLVNMRYIAQLQGNIIVFVNGERAEISRRNIADFNRRYTNYLKYFVR